MVFEKDILIDSIGLDGQAIYLLMNFMYKYAFCFA